MLVMVQYTFEGGPSGRAAYDRFARWKPSAGFEMKGGWTAASNAGGFLLLEVANEGVLLEFFAQFKDLNKEIQVTPVVELSEAVTIVQKAYKWVDSVS